MHIILWTLQKKNAVCIIIAKDISLLRFGFALVEKNAKNNLDLGFINMPIKVNKCDIIQTTR